MRRFWSKVDVRGDGECWQWKAARDRQGYGVFRHRGAMTLAHRACYDIALGGIPPLMHVLHRCDNPCCVNPAHIFLGTNADNVADKMAKGRQAKLSGSSHPRARFNEETVTFALARMLCGESPKDTAKHFSVGTSTAYAVLSGDNWSHVWEASK